MEVYSIMAFAALCLLVLYSTTVVTACKPYENEICWKDHCFCRQCRKCPPGQGPNFHCGERYQNNTVITCVPCKEGISYSEEYGISSCQPCPLCPDGTTTLHACTVTNKTIRCSGCKEGYKMSPLVDNCIPDPLNPAKSSKIIPSATINLLSRTPSKSKKTFNISSSFVIHYTTGPEPKTTNVPIVIKAKKNTSSDHKLMLVVLMILVGIILFFVVTGSIYFSVKKITGKCGTKTDVEKDLAESVALTALPPNQSPGSSEESIEDPQELWDSDFLFQAISSKLSHFLSVKISQPDNLKAGWREIGEELGVSDIDLDTINIPEGEGSSNKGKKLFELLRGSMPGLTLKKVVSVLKKLNREDLVGEIRKSFYSPENIALFN